MASFLEQPDNYALYLRYGKVQRPTSQLELPNYFFRGTLYGNDPEVVQDTIGLAVTREDYPNEGSSQVSYGVSGPIVDGQGFSLRITNIDNNDVSYELAQEAYDDGTQYFARVQITGASCLSAYGPRNVG